MHILNVKVSKCFVQLLYLETNLTRSCASLGTLKANHLQSQSLPRCRRPAPWLCQPNESNAALFDVDVEARGLTYSYLLINDWHSKPHGAGAKPHLLCNNQQLWSSLTFLAWHFKFSFYKCLVLLLNSNVFQFLHCFFVCLFLKWSHIAWHTAEPVCWQGDVEGKERQPLLSGRMRPKFDVALLCQTCQESEMDSYQGRSCTGQGWRGGAESRLTAAINHLHLQPDAGGWEGCVGEDGHPNWVYQRCLFASRSPVE